jgi:phosphoglycolate phosphatase-like HAD superfamily hydrolase
MSSVAHRLLLFDIDGTLLSCSGKGVIAMHRAVQRLWGLAPVAVRIEPQGKTDPMLFDEMAAAYGLPAGALAARGDELHTTYVAALDDELRAPDACVAKPGVPALLQALARRSDVTLAIVSGNLERTAWLKLRAAGVDAPFATGAFGSDARRRADLVALALARCGERYGRTFTAADAWVIGDTPDDVGGGRAHGTRTLAVATGSFTRADLERCTPDVVLDDLTITDTVIDILCRAR